MNLFLPTFFLSSACSLTLFYNYMHSIILIKLALLTFSPYWFRNYILYYFMIKFKNLTCIFDLTILTSASLCTLCQRLEEILTTITTINTTRHIHTTTNTHTQNPTQYLIHYRYFSYIPLITFCHLRKFSRWKKNNIRVVYILL